MPSDEKLIAKVPFCLTASPEVQLHFHSGNSTLPGRAFGSNVGNPLENGGAAGYLREAQAVEREDFRQRRGVCLCPTSFSQPSAATTAANATIMQAPARAVLRRRKPNAGSSSALRAGISRTAAIALICHAPSSQLSYLTTVPDAHRDIMSKTSAGAWRLAQKPGSVNSRRSGAEIPRSGSLS